MLNFGSALQGSVHACTVVSGNETTRATLGAHVPPTCVYPAVNLTMMDDVYQRQKSKCVRNAYAKV
jgi:hypothetical protein